MSFTTTGLLRKETIVVATLFLELQDWSNIRQRVMDENCLQMKALNSRRRIFTEIKARLECLNPAEIRIVCSDCQQDIDIVLWLALCRRYHFIGDFAKEVIREKYLSMQRHIDIADYAIFLERKSEFHPEIQKLTDSTRDRLRQMLFHFMRHCNLINRENNIQTMFISSAIEELFKNGSSAEIAYFPIPQNMVKI